MYGLISALSSTNYVILNKNLIKTLGLHSALFICELCNECNYWIQQGKISEDGYFYCTQDNMEENVGLSHWNQTQIIRDLKEKKIISVDKRGLPSKNYFKINEDVLEMYILNNNISGNQSNSGEKNDGTSPVKITELHHSKSKPNNNKLNNNKIKNNKNNNKSHAPSDEGGVGFELKSKSKSKSLSRYDKCINIINDFTENENIRKLLREYVSLRLEMEKEGATALYANALKGSINKLKKMPEDKWVESISNAIQHGWLTFYEPSNSTYPFNTSSKTIDGLTKGDEYAEERKRIDEQWQHEHPDEEWKAPEF